jgi:hypothetical protein
MNIVKEYHTELLKFKNLHFGETCYIFGSGSTIQQFKIQEEGTFIGCNHIIKNTAIKEKLKYYFFGHGYMKYTNDSTPIYGNHKKEVDLLGNNIQKFAMVSRDNDLSVHLFTLEAVKDLKNINAIPCDINIHHIYKDLENNSFLNHSIVFPAVQFAMYAGFKKIYLVGCDCNGYFHSNNFINTNKYAYIDNDLVYYWKEILKFKNSNYNDCRIINVNPVELKGLMDNDIFL